MLFTLEFCPHEKLMISRIQADKKDQQLMKGIQAMSIQSASILKNRAVLPKKKIPCKLKIQFTLQ